METFEKQRKGNLAFRTSSYLLPREKWPEHLGYDIIKYYPNSCYGKESEYEKEGEWYTDPKYNFRIHEDCFKSKESCYVIAHFSYDDHEGYYDFEFVGDRPLKLTEEERKIFWEFVDYGFCILNNLDEKIVALQRIFQKPFKCDEYGNVIEYSEGRLVFSFLDREDERQEQIVDLLNEKKNAEPLSGVVDIDEDDYLTVNSEAIGKFYGRDFLRKLTDTLFDTDLWDSFRTMCVERLTGDKK